VNKGKRSEWRLQELLMAAKRRRIRRKGNDKRTTWLEQTHDIAECYPRIVEVFKNITQKHHIEAGFPCGVDRTQNDVMLGERHVETNQVGNGRRVLLE